MSAPVPVIEAIGLAKEFPLTSGLTGRRRGGVRAVDGVEFAISRGETLGLVGESGSGKSTVARLATRLLPASGGELRIEGRNVAALSRRERRSLRSVTQMVFQDPYSSFDPLATVADSVAEPLRVHTSLDGAARAGRVEELLELVGLSGPTHGRRRPSELSGGQLQRAAIARALAPEPSLVVLDEPASALDLSTQAQVINLLAQLQRELGISYLFISHDLSVVRHVSHRIAVMYLGRIVEEGPAETVYQAPRHPYTDALLSAVPVVDTARERARERIVLVGDMPSPAAPPPGCRFHTRCPWAMDVCRTVDPPAFETRDGATVFCHLHTTGPILAGATVQTLHDAERVA